GVLSRSHGERIGDRASLRTRPTSIETTDDTTRLGRRPAPGAEAPRRAAPPRHRGGLSVEVLQELVCCKLDLFVPPRRGTVVTGDQPHPVQTAKVAIDKREA